MNLVLIGYRGTGKSTIARLLTEQLGWGLISTDAEIVKKAQRSIPEIVDQFGWDHFRQLESEICERAATQDHMVIDTGGGVIVREENIRVLQSQGIIFWLTATIHSISQRIGGDKQRPSLTAGKTLVEEIEEVLRERTPKYQAAAHYAISTDTETPKTLVKQILTLMNSHGSP